LQAQQQRQASQQRQALQQHQDRRKFYEFVLNRPYLLPRLFQDRICTSAEMSDLRDQQVSSELSLAAS
jgi:hypothetical protein